MYKHKVMKCLGSAPKKGETHALIVSDLWVHSSLVFPIFVNWNDVPKARRKKHIKQLVGPFDKVLEIYNFNKPILDQLEKNINWEIDD